MSDGSGSTTFHYDQLSRLDWEERAFNGLTNAYRISYAYNLAGELKTITDPTQFGTSLGYQHDLAGRLTSVTGSGYSYTDSSNSQVPVSTFASNISYRAWNMMRDLDDGSGVHHHFDFNSRLLASDYMLSNLAGSTGTMRWNYDYYADGNINHAYDVADNHFDRAFAYDHLGRLTEGTSGREARGESIPANTTPDSPYRHTYSYDVWSNQTSQTGRWWQRGLAVGYGYTNNRQQGVTYDAAGHVIQDSIGAHVFDARGARTLVTAGTVGGGQTGNSEQPAEETANTYDGDGQSTKTIVTSRTEDLIAEGPTTNITTSVATTYYLRSSVLGGYVVAEMDAQGERTKGYVYAGGQRLAEYTITPYSHTIVWQHKNPLTGSWVEVAANGGTITRREMDPLGRDVGTSAPPNPNPLSLSTPSPASRDPLYEIQGGPSQEAELGMQLYEDLYINHKYGGGAGPGEGGFWEQWNNHVTEREGQLMAGGHFLFGIDRMNAGVSGDRHEFVEQWDNYETEGGNEIIGYDDEGRPQYAAGISVSKDVGYFRLVPGSPQKKVPLGVQFLRDPLTGSSYGKEKEGTIRAIVDRMLRDPCTKAFEAAGLTPPSKLMENGVFIGPATLLSDSSAENFAKMGITEGARNRDAELVNSFKVKAFTEVNLPGYLPDTVDGRPRIFLNHSAFQPDDNALGDYLRHEFIHAGGAPPKDTLFSSDLAYLGWKHVRVGNGTKGEGIYQWERDGPTEQEIKDACR